MEHKKGFKIKRRIIMKKVLSLLMIFALVLTAFVGCGEKVGLEAQEEMTSQEVFDKVQEVSADMTNTSFFADFDLEMTGLEEMGLAGPMGLTLSGDIKDAENMMINMEVEAQGMTIAGDIYMAEKKMLIHVPMLQGIMGYAYVSADMDTIAEQAGTPVTQPDPEKINAIMKRFEETTEYSIYDMYQLNEEKSVEEIVVNEETIEATKLTANIDLLGSKDMIIALVQFMMTDEEAKEVFFAGMTDEDMAMVQAQLEDEAAMAELDAALEMITVNEFSTVMYINADYQTIKTELVMDFLVTDPEAGMDMNVKLTGFMDYFNIGGVESITIPEVDPSQVMDLNDMM